MTDSPVYSGDSSQKEKTQLESQEKHLLAEPAETLSGVVRVPGDKSISHRAIMLGALADGVTEVSGFLEGADVLSTLNAFRDLGVVINGPQDGRLSVCGVGLRGLQAPEKPLDCGNAGTAMRLMMGVLSGQSFETILVGDESLSLRPMRRVVDPLMQMGAKIETNQGCPPVHIRGTALHAIHYHLPVASAQVKSAVLLAGLYANGETRVMELIPTRDHTERLLAGFGAKITRVGGEIRLLPGVDLKSTGIDVPADISSAAFFLVGASIAAHSDLTLLHVGMNPARTGVLSILRAMGGDIQVFSPREVGGEPVADLRVRSVHLKGIEIPLEWVPLAIDEFPILFIAAACAQGTTILKGAQELRVKESDRIAVMAKGLSALGVKAWATKDGMIIEGKSGPAFKAGTVDSQGDHRVAMAFAMASLRAEGPIRILNAENIKTSFPGFLKMARQAGLLIFGDG